VKLSLLQFQSEIAIGKVTDDLASELLK
jgi:hypothetical protein